MVHLLKEPIIFLGFPRSGTTIISEPILQHHKLAWISNYQEKFPDSCSINLIRNLFDNSFWKIRGQKKQLNKIPFLNEYIFKPSESYGFWDQITGKDFSYSFLFQEEASEFDVKRMQLFFERLVKYQNKERLAFKITGPSRLTYLQSLFPDAFIIFIKRKPLPTLRSLLKTGFWQERGETDLLWEPLDVYTSNEKQFIEKWKKGNPALLAAIQYHKVHEIFNREKEQLGQQCKILEISYETFIEYPETVLGEILKFVNLQRDCTVKRYLKENEIYNRNEKNGYYISPELDSCIYEIATSGGL